MKHTNENMASIQNNRSGPKIFVFVFLVLIYFKSYFVHIFWGQIWSKYYIIYVKFTHLEKPDDI